MPLPKQPFRKRGMLLDNPLTVWDWEQYSNLYSNSVSRIIEMGKKHSLLVFYTYRAEAGEVLKLTNVDQKICKN